MMRMSSSMSKMSRMSTRLHPLESETDRRERRAAASRANYAANPLAVSARVRSYRIRNPHKRAAHLAVKRALHSGALIKPPHCSGDLSFSQITCSNPRTDAHHDDYSLPLSVIWLCRSCHRRRHSHLHAVGKDPD